MAEPTVTCPKCNTDIPLTESLAAPLIQATRKKYEQQVADKERDVAAREKEVRTQLAALADERCAIEATVAERLLAERVRIAEEEGIKAKQNAALEMESRTREIRELRDLLKEREEKLAESQRIQAEVLRKERKLEDDRREMELNIEKQVQAGLELVREKARQEAEDALKLRLSEREETIASMQRQIEELKRKAEQGSQQLQGEVLELELEAMLRTKFVRDIIEPVPKGEFGGDVLQRVMGPGDQPCGLILWESKRTKNWTDGWLAKLREDQRKAKADVALIVSNALPKGVQTFDHVDGVWVAEPRCAIPVAIALRQSLVELALARQAREGQQTKMELIYHYLTGPHFKQRIQAIVERFNEMQSDLDKERTAMTRMWAKREKQIRAVIESTAGMYGDLQGIAGKALDGIEALDLPSIEYFSKDRDQSIPS